MEITNQTLRAIKALFRKLGIDQEQQATMISGFSHARTTHCTEISQPEANRIIRHLRGLDPDEKGAERMRRKLIAMAHEIKWEKPGTGQADMERVDGWCRKFSSLKKSLNRHTYKQLPGLLSQFQLGPYQDHIAKSKKSVDDPF